VAHEKNKHVEGCTVREDTEARHRAKYSNKSLVHQLLLGRFLDAVAARLETLQMAEALDFGCGEALFWQEMQARGIHMNALTGIDLRADALAQAGAQFPEYRFLETDLLSWEPDHPFDLVIASQVLEHIPEPGPILNKLVQICSPEGELLLTVPWEPFFRIGNLARGRDIRRLGNHPEHVNHWGVGSFRRFIEPHAQIIEADAIFPFLLIRARPY
jgi:2-polyprenyl-3-methyl-5-hydroxy-6-metoxy-1,4-benzoquinol methylase